MKSFRLKYDFVLVALIVSAFTEYLPSDMFNFEGIKSLFVSLKFGQFSWNTNAFSNLMHNLIRYCRIRSEKNAHSVTNKFDFTLDFTLVFCLQLKILKLLKK